MALLPILQKMEDRKLVFEFRLLFKHIQAAFILTALHFVLTVIMLGHVEGRMTFPEEWFPSVRFCLVNQAGGLLLKLVVKLLHRYEIRLCLVELTHLVIELLFHFFGARGVSVSLQIYFCEFTI